MEFQKLYCDLFCLHDKVHTYHIRTVNMPECATIHSTLGSIYEKLDDLTDKVGEDIIIKYLKQNIPSFKEIMSDIGDNDAETPEDIVMDVYNDCEKLESYLAILNNQANNCLAQSLSPIWKTFTDFCADLRREMED